MNGMTAGTVEDRVRHAYRTIDPLFLNSPFYSDDALSAALGASVRLKLETANPIRSFKGRGTDYYLATNPDAAELVCASVGNFGQGLAYAGRKRGVKVTVFVQHGANQVKVDRIASFGARVVHAGSDFDAAKDAAAADAAERGLPFVEDGAVQSITDGAATMGLEMLESGREFDVLLVPVGNGALVNGVGGWVRRHRPEIEVVGVAAANAACMYRSWRENRLIETDTAVTVAEGIGVRKPVPIAVEQLRDSVTDMVLVSEEALLQAVRTLRRHAGLIIEPGGAAGIAAMIEHKPRWRGARVATILCGGNVTEEQFAKWLA